MKNFMRSQQACPIFTAQSRQDLIVFSFFLNELIKFFAIFFNLNNLLEFIVTPAGYGYCTSFFWLTYEFFRTHFFLTNESEWLMWPAMQGGEPAAMALFCVQEDQELAVELLTRTEK
ncbi:hypothetical protein [Bacillus atrophaeus]|uniref:hypothetical protein n=1 Tax=Bacillus atrophaeus TaxID=1452 RepID=UPI002280E1EA|nr:hypothetical protein [Bacillus atrophaeus]MCY8478058.1 hypothetical protein [Bacillus atrophaeus]